MKIQSSLTRSIPALGWTIAVGAWLLLVNRIGWYTWNHGPSTFAALLALVGLILLLTKASLSTPIRSSRIPMLIAVLLTILFVTLTATLVISSFSAGPGPIVDIGANTYAACVHFANGLNPYAERAQLMHRLETQHSEDETVTLYGLRYRYGYPYFPAMFLSYAPAFAAVESYQFIRAFNSVLLLVNLLALGVLARSISGRLLHPDHSASTRRLVLATTVATTIALSLGVVVYAGEIFHNSIVDIVISTYALLAFVALDRGRPRLGGVLMGFAQACKLLPGPFLVLPIAVMLWKRPELRSFVGGYLVTSVGIIAPFLLWDAESFLSATILYYLVNHGSGDSTSLWFFLPQGIQPIFSFVGALLALLLSLKLPRPGVVSMTAGLSAAFTGYAVFMAFSRMTHLNYLWSIYPLGCTAFAVLLSRVFLTPRVDTQERPA